MKWFGNPWPSDELRAAVCEDDEQKIPVPLGEECMFCQNLFEAEDQGVTMPHISIGGPTTSSAHIDCLIRSVGGTTESRTE